jgi:hypothetical protein
MLQLYRRALFALSLLAISAIAPVAADQSPRIADPAAPQLVEPHRFVATPARLERTIVLPAGSERAGETLFWEVRIGDERVAAGRAATTAGAAENERATLSIPLPGLAQPVGMDLVVEVRRTDRKPLRSIFPFTLYPREPGEAIVSLFRQSTVALYDPCTTPRGALRGFSSRSGSGSGRSSITTSLSTTRWT